MVLRDKEESGDDARNIKHITGQDDTYVNLKFYLIKFIIKGRGSILR